MLRFLNPSGAVGLELDTDTIRVLELRSKGKSVYPAVVEQISIPAEAVVEGTINDVDAVTDALINLWAKARISKREVVLGLSNQGIIMRSAFFPKRVEKKLAQVIRFQAEDLFPIPIAELVVDYSVIGDTGNGGDQIEVLLVGAKRDMLEKCLQALAGAGLTPEIIDTSFLALTRLLNHRHLTETLVVVDIANGNCTLLLVENGKPRFARFIQHSLKSYTGEMHLALEALDQAAVATDEPEMSDNNLSNNRYSVLIGEIRNSVGYYVARHDEINVNSLLLSGRGARLPGLKEYKEQHLNVPVTKIEPPAKLVLSHSTSLLYGPDEWLDFAVCTGLAMRGLGG